MKDDVTVVIPSIPTRSKMLLTRAIPSVLRQTRPADAIAVPVDNHRVGAWENRNIGIRMVATKWMAFLDDDDELLPHHLEFLVNLANAHQADVAWGWFEVVGGSDPFPQHRGRQWDINDPHCFTITTLVNTDLVMSANAQFRGDPDKTGDWGVQDRPFWESLWRAGGKFIGSDEITWRWHHHGSNTSGLPARW